MPISVMLSFCNRPEVTKVLGQNPALVHELHEAAARRPPAGTVATTTINVTGHAIAKDLYGRTHDTDPAEVDFLQAFANQDVFRPEDAGAPANLLGDWNENFIKWVKSTARQATTGLWLEYTHERGDDVYESAIWEFPPGAGSDGTDVVERFDLGLHVRGPDGGRASLQKTANGTVITRLSQANPLTGPFKRPTV